MENKKRWDIKSKHTLTKTKFLLANLSIKVRTSQFHKFISVMSPKPSTKVLDVGVTSDETLKDSNMFEKLYKHHSSLSVATVEDSKKIKKLYPKLKRVISVESHKKLPLKDKSFDIVVSWATLEHTGNYADQEFFLNELLRVGKRVYITTPYRGAVYEPHTGLFFLHWLPLSIFRQICSLIGKKFWSNEQHLNPLWVEDIKKMRLNRKVEVKVYKTFNLIPSHILIIA